MADGTLCDGGGGQCMDGACVDINLCMNVSCADLGECRSNVCNPDTGQCEASDLPDGTSCDSGAGVCTGGACTQAGAVLVVDKTGPPAVFTSQQFQFTIEVENTGDEDAENVVLVDTLPAAGSFVSSNPVGVLEGRALSFELGNLGAGQKASVSVTWVAPSAETAIINRAEASADNASTAGDDHLVDVGTQTIVTGGATAAGTGLRHRDSGTITITGVPSAAVVTRAVLVWALLYRTPIPSNQITFEGQRISADLTQTISDDLCWADLATIGYAADVTSLVSGNGTYTVSDPVNAITRIDNNPIPTFPLTDGASLIVFYGGAGFNAQVLSDFSYSAESQNNTQNVRTLEGINSLGRKATLILSGPDGQSNFGERVRAIGSKVLDFDNSWNGSDSQLGPDFYLGNLWDTDVHDVTSIMPLGQSTLTVELGLGNDCTGLSAVVLQVAQ